jgi:3-deoxy-manno-octulosonate cytidylyltransferase (CMP-KDO synthetase)
MILGKSLLERTWRIAKAVKGVDEVYIATEDERIAEHATSFGAKAQITSSSCTNGTERILDALKRLALKPQIIINLQGDAVLTPPHSIEALVDTLKKKREVGFATLAVKLSEEQYEELRLKKTNSSASGTLVTFDRTGKALYFSKSIIPYVRHQSNGQKAQAGPPIYRHIGLYAYRYDVLTRYVNLEPTPLEICEGLEQLRALENGIPIQVVEVDYKGRTHWSVDSPEDAKMAEQIILREGELLV